MPLLHPPHTPLVQQLPLQKHPLWHQKPFFLHPQFLPHPFLHEHPLPFFTGLDDPISIPWSRPLPHLRPLLLWLGGSWWRGGNDDNDVDPRRVNDKGTTISLEIAGWGGWCSGRRQWRQWWASQHHRITTEGPPGNGNVNTPVVRATNCQRWLPWEAVRAHQHQKPLYGSY
jgi:hypothetical protein